MREVTIKYYLFEELGEEAKKRAIKDWRESDSGKDNFLVTETLKNKLTEYLFTDTEIYWSLSCCQGDGVSFTAEITLENAVKAVGKHLTEKEKNQLKRIEGAGIEFNYIQNHLSCHYTHGRTISTHINWGELSGSIYRYSEKLVEKVAKYTDDYRLEICGELESIGYKEIDSMNSDEYITETLDSIGYEFLENGKIIY